MNNENIKLLRNLSPVNGILSYFIVQLVFPIVDTHAKKGIKWGAKILSINCLSGRSFEDLVLSMHMQQTLGQVIL